MWYSLIPWVFQTGVPCKIILGRVCGPVEEFRYFTDRGWVYPTEVPQRGPKFRGGKYPAVRGEIFPGALLHKFSARRHSYLERHVDGVVPAPSEPDLARASSPGEEAGLLKVNGQGQYLRRDIKKEAEFRPSHGYKSWSH